MDNQQLSVQESGHPRKVDSACEDDQPESRPTARLTEIGLEEVKPPLHKKSLSMPSTPLLSPPRRKSLESQRCSLKSRDEVMRETRQVLSAFLRQRQLDILRRQDQLATSYSDPSCLRFDRNKRVSLRSDDGVKDPPTSGARLRPKKAFSSSPRQNRTITRQQKLETIESVIIESDKDISMKSAVSSEGQSTSEMMELGTSTNDDRISLTQSTIWLNDDVISVDNSAIDQIETKSGSQSSKESEVNDEQLTDKLTTNKESSTSSGSLRDMRPRVKKSYFKRAKERLQESFRRSPVKSRKKSEHTVSGGSTSLTPRHSLPPRYSDGKCAVIVTKSTKPQSNKTVDQNANVHRSVSDSFEKRYAVRAKSGKDRREPPNLRRRRKQKSVIERIKSSIGQREKIVEKPFAGTKKDGIPGQSSTENAETKDAVKRPKSFPSPLRTFGFKRSREQKELGETSTVFESEIETGGRYDLRKKSREINKGRSQYFGGSGIAISGVFRRFKELAGRKNVGLKDLPKPNQSMGVIGVVSRHSGDLSNILEPDFTAAANIGDSSDHKPVIRVQKPSTTSAEAFSPTHGVGGLELESPPLSQTMPDQKGYVLAGSSEVKVTSVLNDTVILDGERGDSTNSSANCSQKTDSTGLSVPLVESNLSEMTREATFDFVAKRLLEIGDEFDKTESIRLQTEEIERCRMEKTPELRKRGKLERMALEKEMVDWARTTGDGILHVVPQDEMLRALALSRTQDEFSRLMTEFTGPTGPETEENEQRTQLALVFRALSLAIKLVGPGSASKLTEFCLDYIRGKFADWIIGRGGWLSVVEESSSPSDLD